MKDAFELDLPLFGGHGEVVLYQRPYPATRKGVPQPLQLVGRCPDEVRVAIWDAVLDTLRADGIKPPTPKSNVTLRVALSERGGVRLGLLLVTIQGVHGAPRIEALYRGVWAMSDEEAYYWFAKCWGANGSRGRHAIRVLLIG